MRACMVLLLLALAAGPAQAWVYIGSSCDGDTISISVSISHAAVWGITGMNLRWAPADTPAQQEMVLAQPFPVAATDDVQSFTVRVAAPIRERLLIYYTHFTGVNGEQLSGSDPACSWLSSYAICGELFLFRATIFDFGPQFAMEFNYCDPLFNGCGGSDLDLQGAPDWQSFVNTGRLVNVYGSPGVVQNPPCAMPGTGCPTVTRLEFENDPAGCAAVATESMTWGSLKSAYR